MISCPSARRCLSRPLSCRSCQLCARARVPVRVRTPRKFLLQSGGGGVEEVASPRGHFAQYISSAAKFITLEVMSSSCLFSTAKKTLRRPSVRPPVTSEADLQPKSRPSYFTAELSFFPPFASSPCDARQSWPEPLTAAFKKTRRSILHFLDLEKVTRNLVLFLFLTLADGLCSVEFAPHLLLKGCL